jgi:tetratricopeptide (TPR) repeat protein
VATIGDPMPFLRSAPALIVVLGSFLASVLGASSPQPSISPAWMSVLQEYRGGDADRAVREVLSWPKERLEKQVATEADCTRLIAQKDIETVRAAIALHAEAAVSCASLECFRSQDRVPLVLFTKVVENLWPALGTEERKALRGLFDDWTVLGSSYLSTLGQPLLAQRRVEDARTRLPRLQATGTPVPGSATAAGASIEDDPALLLALGSAREMVLMLLGASPQVAIKATASRGNGAATAPPARSAELESVAELYRRALALDPSRVEARVRLGRVLCLAGHAREAVVELKRARQDAGQGYLFYLASLFLGDAYERVGEHGMAADSYRSAIAEYPEAQAAYLGLASVPQGAAPEPGPVNVLTQMFGAEAGRRPERDPWWMYPYGQAWQSRARIDALRRMVRK